jgi:hypothetical protein
MIKYKQKVTVQNKFIINNVIVPTNNKFTYKINFKQYLVNATYLDMLNTYSYFENKKYKTIQYIGSTLVLKIVKKVVFG